MHFVLLFSLVFVFFLSRTLARKDPRLFCVIGMGFCLFLFGALRSWMVGSDTWNYFAGYVHDADMDYVHLITYYQGRDPLFHIFQRALSEISASPQYFAAVVSAIVAAGFSYFAYNQKGNVLLIYIMFVTFRLYAFTLSGLRQALAMSIVFVAYVFLQQNKKLIYFLGLVLLASLFHQSALIFIIAYPLVKYKKTNVVALGTIGLGVINTFLGGSIAATMSSLIFKSRFEGYMLNDFTFGASTTFLLYIVMFIVVYANKNKMTSIDPAFPASLRILCAGIMFSILGQSLPNLFRVSYYFIFPLFSLFGFALYSSMSNRQRTPLIAFIVIALSLQYIVLDTGGGVNNYEFFWENPYVYSSEGLFD